MARKLWRGNTGSSVRELQQKLNQNGYHLDEDGVFGSNTYRAVVDYQKKNKLLVDGVVGDETWGSLNKVQQAAVPTKPTTGKDVMKGVSDETYNKLHKLEQGYVPSDEVETAQEIRRSIEAMQPEKYKSSFEDELSQLYEQIAQRKPFAYDPQTDAQYKNYAYQYARRGRDAMEDTIGTAAGLTGGYASSYAQTASQQAYDRYMQELAELMPELESSARQRDQDQRHAGVSRHHHDVAKRTFPLQQRRHRPVRHAEHRDQQRQLRDLEQHIVGCELLGVEQKRLRLLRPHVSQQHQRHQDQRGGQPPAPLPLHVPKPVERMDGDMQGKTRLLLHTADHAPAPSFLFFRRTRRRMTAATAIAAQPIATGANQCAAVSRRYSAYALLKPVFFVTLSPR